MVEAKDGVLAVISAIGAAVAHALGGWDAALKVLLALMAADYVTGLLVAAVWHKSTKTESGAASSAAGFKGLMRKFVVLLIVGMGEMLDRAMGIDYVRTAVCLFYIANEGLSILENTAAMGVPYPKFVKDMLDVMRDKSSNGQQQNAVTEETKHEGQM